MSSSLRFLLVAGACLVTVALSLSAAPDVEHGSPVTRVAAAVRAAITPQRLEAHARRIVENERLSGSPGENAAIDYIISTLRADGITVEVDSFMAYTSDPIRAELSLVGSDGTSLLSPHAITVAFSASTNGLVAPMVDVGDAELLPDPQPGTLDRLTLAEEGSSPIGATEPTPGTNETQTSGARARSATEMRALAAKLRGAIAVVTGTPGPDEAWKLQELGAAGALFINPADRLNDLVTTTVWGSPSLRDMHRIPRLPVAEITHRDGVALRARLTGAGGGALRLRLSAETRTGWKMLRLVVARIEPGERPKNGASYALLGGHIDAWYHGGTDEGASNAAMLELARAFHANRRQLQRGLVVAWWPGHSNGRYAGSTWFADHRFAELRDRAIAYLNVDGIGQRGAKRYGVSATASMAPLAQQVLRERTGATDVRVGRPGRDSDQSFGGIGLPLLQFSHDRLAADSGYWWWHTPDDTFDKIDFGILQGDAALYGDALSEILVAPVPPIDVAAEIEALAKVLSQRDAEGKGQFDLSVPIARVARLAEMTRDIQRLVRARTNAPIDIDRALVRILRPMHRVTYTLSGAYHPDPAVSFGLLPGLAEVRTLASAPAGSDLARFAEVTLVRERNRLIDALDASLALAEMLKARLTTR
ncbi:MAG: M28 family peptidase [Gemmatimonadaceae bacterium]